jgi:hypothetical protein
MSKRARSDPKNKSKSKCKTSLSARSTPFGQPPLLEGEDAAAYDELLARIRAAVKPADVIDEMFIDDVVSLEWDLLRWRRLKFTLIRARAIKALNDLLADKLPDHLFEDYFADDLTEFLQEHLPKDQAEKAQRLAHACVRDEPGATNTVDEVLDKTDLELDDILDQARARKAAELVQAYTRREPDAVTLIHQLLADPRVSLDTMMADALARELDYVERVDRLAAIAESRRNASLREIDQRRAVLGQALRRSMQEVEDADFKMIETTPTKEKEQH